MSEGQGVGECGDEREWCEMIEKLTDESTESQ